MNKQIKEMALLITEGARPAAEDAEALFNAGYRKASDVAHEIFAWIEEHMYNANFVRGTVEIDFCSYLAFKKKYESEGGE